MSEETAFRRARGRLSTCSAPPREEGWWRSWGRWWPRPPSRPRPRSRWRRISRRWRSTRLEDLHRLEGPLCHREGGVCTRATGLRGRERPRTDASEAAAAISDGSNQGSAPAADTRAEGEWPCFIFSVTGIGERRREVSTPTCRPKTRVRRRRWRWRLTVLSAGEARQRELWRGV